MRIADAFLPVSKADLAARSWTDCDFVLVTGDAYVDHPSFGAALVSRLLESKGFRVGILAQPDWTDPAAFSVLGKPRLAFLVTAGNLDSMVNHYTANKKPRSEDAYSPGGLPGRRPDRALIAYCNKIRQAFPGAAIVIGGLEASLRRLTHYDYWSDTLKKSVLLDAKADIGVYGMGERAILEIAQRLAAGEPIKSIRGVRGSFWRTGKDTELPPGVQALPAHEAQKADKAVFAAAFAIQYRNADALSSRALVEGSQAGFVVQEPPALPLTGLELDELYSLPFARAWHPSYDKAGGIPALAEVKFSLVSSRGCFGACSFCALAFHQGRHVQARSKESLVAEATLLSSLPDFKGIIHDVGGPTANFRQDPCPSMTQRGACPDRRCLSPQACPNLKADHRDYLDVLRTLRALPGVKRVFIRSGIRFDYLMLDPDPAFLEELCAYHVSGQLKVAPEHVSERVLRAMGKPPAAAYRSFRDAFASAARKSGKELYLIPYYVSAHPGSTLEDAIELALALKADSSAPDQIQDYYPTPGTLSSCMYYAGIDPLSGESVYVARGEKERRLQRALLHFHKPENAALVREALVTAGRPELISVLRPRS